MALMSKEKAKEEKKEVKEIITKVVRKKRSSLRLFLKRKKKVRRRNKKRFFSFVKSFSVDKKKAILFLGTLLAVRTANKVPKNRIAFLRLSFLSCRRRRTEISWRTRLLLRAKLKRKKKYSAALLWYEQREFYATGSKVVVFVCS